MTHHVTVIFLNSFFFWVLYSFAVGISNLVRKITRPLSYPEIFVSLFLSRERLYRIQDQKSFKTEMMDLCLELSKDEVDEHVRPSLMEIVIP